MKRTIAAEHAAVAFFTALREQYNSAVSRCGLERQTFRIHDSTISIGCAGRVPRALLDALAHCLSGNDTEADLSIEILDSGSTGVPSPRMPWRADDIRELGFIRGFNSGRFYTNFNVDSMLLTMIDMASDAGVVWRRTMDNIAFYERAAPLRHIISPWFVQRRKAHLVHSAAVGIDGKCVLLAGLGGSGKSTTAIACMSAGMEYLGDDYALVSLDPQPTAHSAYCTAKLHPHDLRRFPRLAEITANRREMHNGKAIFYLTEFPEANIVSSARLQAVVVPVITGEQCSKIVPSSPAAALRALAPSTIFQLWGPSREQFGFLSDLVRRVPCYSLQAGTEIDELPEVIGDLLEKLNG